MCQSVRVRAWERGKGGERERVLHSLQLLLRANSPHRASPDAAEPPTPPLPPLTPPRPLRPLPGTRLRINDSEFRVSGLE